MANTINFDDAKRRLDRALEQMDAPADASHDPPEPVKASGADADGPATPDARQSHASPGPADARHEQPQPSLTTEALARLVVGAAVLGLDALAARAPLWEQRAGIERGEQAEGGAGAAITARGTGEARFRHGLIGWIFETEEELRPEGNPLKWLRKVVGHLFGSVFSVVFDSLPRLGPRRRREVAPASDQETARWVARGQREEPCSRAFAVAALDDIVTQAIPYLARQRGVQQAIAELVRSPAIDDAIVALARREGVQQAIAELVRSPAIDDAIVALARREGVQQAVAELVRSPAIDDAVTAIVRSPAMEGAVTHIVSTQAMHDAIETLSRSPALVQLVQTQSTSIAGEIMEDVRERGVSGDLALEGLVRRILRRQPRSALPPDAQGLIVTEPARRR